MLLALSLIGLIWFLERIVDATHTFAKERKEFNVLINRIQLFGRQAHCNAWRWIHRLPQLLLLFALIAGLTDAVAADRVFLGKAVGVPLKASADPDVTQTLNVLRQQAAKIGLTRVIVGVRAAFAPEGLMAKASVTQQRDDIATMQAAVLDKVLSLKMKPEMVHSYQFIPFMALSVSAAELDALASLPEVTSIEEDKVAHPHLAESVPLIGGTTAWSSGYTGAGQTIAILDTGVDKTHPFLAGKVVYEACHSASSILAGTKSLCPGFFDNSTSAGSAMPYASGLCPYGKCDHGTHVAGIAAGKGVSYSGVAKDASIIAIQVFHFSTGMGCPPTDPTNCVAVLTSDYVKGLDDVYNLRDTFNIAAVNMSLGDGGNYNDCTSSTFVKSAVDQLRAANIATVASSGNEGYLNGMGEPACISSVISVGATWDATASSLYCPESNSTVDNVACYSNSASFLSLLAPGSAIESSVPGGYTVKHGTSMAAPHVAGAWALLKQANSALTVAEGLALLRSTGKPVTDTRNGITTPRISINDALHIVTPAVMTTPVPGTTLPGSSVPFGWSAGSGISQYLLQIGTSAGGSDLYNQSQGTNLSATVTGLPTNGQPVHVTLKSMIGGVWQSSAYTYTAFSITPSTPTITSISLPSYVASSTPQTMTINGTNFTSASTLKFYYPSGAATAAHAPVTTTSSQLTYASFWPTAGVWYVQVLNGAVPSVKYSFTISSAATQLVSLSIAGPATVNQNSSQLFTATALKSDGSTSTVTANWTVSGSVASIGPTSGQLTAGTVSGDTLVTVSANYTTGGLTRSAIFNVTIVKTGSGGGSTTHDLIVNGGFENTPLGTGWVLAGAGVSTTGLYPHTGTKYAAMGEVNNAADTMYQAVTIPANAASAILRYWYNITTQETTSCFCDTLNVSIRNTSGIVLATVAIKSNADKDLGAGNPYYREQTFDLFAYRGQTIWVHFQAYTDYGFPTNFKIDDVSLQVAVPQPVTVASLAISGPTSVVENSSAPYSATAVFSDGTTSIVTPSTWSSSNASAATFAPSGVLSTNSVNSDTLLTASATYTFGGLTRNSSMNVTVVDVPVTDLIPPTIPSYLSASSAGSNQISLSWGASTDSGTGLGGYEIWRCTGSGCSNFVQLTSTAAATTTFNDTGLGSGTSYSYKVRAFDNVGNPSNFTTPSTAITTIVVVAPSGCTITPLSPTATVGATAKAFTASCASGAPTSYAWTVDSVAVAGSANTYTTVANLGVGAHPVAFTAWNTGGPSTPATFTTLTVSAVPAPSGCTITPLTPSATVGATAATFTATCTSGAPTSYAWTVDSLAVAGSTNIYTTVANLGVGSHTVAFTASNTGGSSTPLTSTTFTVSTASAPSCSIAPTTAYITSGLTQLFTTICTNGPTTYQWLLDGVQVANGAASSYNTLATLAVGSHTVSVVASNGSGPGNTATATVTVTAAQTGTCVLQPSPGKDTHYGTVYRTNGMPDADYMSTGGWGDQYLSFVEFDISTLPPATNVTSAEIWLYFLGGGNDPVALIHRITSPWTAASVSLANHPTSVYYSNGPAKPLVPGWYRVSITQLYRDWKNGVFPNYGIQTVPTAYNNNNGLNVASSENADPTIRPKIVVTTSDGSCGLQVPGTPSILSITPGPGRVTITLQPPSNTGGGPIVSYSAICAASGHPNATATSTTTTIIVPGLVPGASYACTATASNGTYTSPATPATSAIPKPKVDLTPILMLLLD